MGTYTANYNLYLPTVEEQGWGDLMNGNLTTIDTTMAGLNTRVGTAESNITSLDSRLDIVETYGSRITAIENEVNGNLSCTNVTASNTLTANKIVVPMNNNGHITLYSMNISTEEARKVVERLHLLQVVLLMREHYMSLVHIQLIFMVRYIIVQELLRYMSMEIS